MRYFTTQFFVPECLKNLLNILGSGSRIDNVKALNEGDHSFFCVFFVFSWVKMRLDFAFRQRFYLFDTS